MTSTGLLGNSKGPNSCLMIAARSVPLTTEISMKILWFCPSLANYWENVWRHLRQQCSSPDPLIPPQLAILHDVANLLALTTH